MPSIGELYVSLGLRTEASVENGLRKLQKIGETATKVTQTMNAVARGSASVWTDVTRAVGTTNIALSQLGSTSKTVVREIGGIGTAMKQISKDAEFMATRQVQLIHAMRSATNRTLTGGNGLSGLGGLNFGGTGIAGIAGTAREDAARARAAMASQFGRIPDIAIPRRRTPSPGDSALAELARDLNSVNGPHERGPDTPYRRASVSMRNFLVGKGGGSNINWGGEGDPFNPSSGGGGGVGTPRGGGGGRPGRGRSGSSGGNMSRFGPLGELSMYRRVILGAGIYQAVGEITQMADTYTQLQNRLRNVTSSNEELQASFNRLRGIARNTRSDFATTTEVYVRLKNSTADMNLSSEDQFKLIERINMAMAVSGASASEMKSGLTQLSQALAKGKLDGDEFRSIAENMPNILKLLGDSLHKTEGQIRAMSKSGQLTREVIVKAFLTNDKVVKQFGNTTDTLGNQWQQFKADLMIAVGQFAKDTNLLEVVKETLGLIAKVLLLLLKILGPVVKGIGAFVKGLKDGKPWAIALAAVLATMLLPQIISLVFWMGRLAAMPFAAIASNFMRLRGFATGGGLASLTGAAGGGAGAAGGGAAGAGGVGAAGAAGVGVIPIVGQAILAGIMLREAANWGKNETGIGNGKGGFLGGMVDALTFSAVDLWGSTRKIGSKDLSASVMNGAMAQVSIGPTTVNIYAKDGKDAAEQFSEEIMNRRNREAAAVFNRNGS